MYKITSVNYNYYHSDRISKEIFEYILLHSKCNYMGKLRLILEENKNFKIEGPYFVPPIRWIDGFENSATFDVTCDVKEVI